MATGSARLHVTQLEFAVGQPDCDGELLLPTQHGCCLLQMSLLSPTALAGGRTTLHWAAHHGMVKVLEEILGKVDASDVDAADELG